MIPAAELCVEVDRSTLSLCALACAREQNARYPSLTHVLLARAARAGEESVGCAATDGKRLHVSRALADAGADAGAHPECRPRVAWVPVRAVEALDTLLRGDEREVALEVRWTVGAVPDHQLLATATSSSEVVGSVGFWALPEERGMPLDTLLAVASRAARPASDLVATLDAKALAALKVSSLKAGLVMVAGGADASPQALVRALPVPDGDEDETEPRARARRVVEEAGSRRRASVQASYLQDAVRFVVGATGKLAKGETVNLYLSDPARNGSAGWSYGPVVLEGRERLAIVMPTSAA